MCSGKGICLPQLEAALNFQRSDRRISDDQTGVAIALELGQRLVQPGAIEAGASLAPGHVDRASDRAGRATRPNDDRLARQQVHRVVRRIRFVCLGNAYMAFFHGDAHVAIASQAAAGTSHREAHAHHGHAGIGGQHVEGQLRVAPRAVKAHIGTGRGIQPERAAVGQQHLPLLATRGCE